MTSRFARRPELGRRAEAIAAAHLEAKGYRILARNWRRAEGELDLVAADGDVWVFVEVRSRTGDEQGHPLESVGPRKRAQVIRAARLYLDEEPVRGAAGFRFDVVGVLFSAEGDLLECTHIEEAFDLSAA